MENSTEDVVTTDSTTTASPVTSMDWDNVDWSKFSEREAHRLRHRMIEEKHRGHEAMHAEMILILFAAALIAQVVLVMWKLQHKKSYHVITLFGMWVIPLYISVRAEFWRMISVWTLFSVITLFVTFKATRRKISPSTPRLVYRWFLFTHQATYIVGVIGYVMMVTLLSGLVYAFPSIAEFVIELSASLIFYGMYFGVLGRDFAELCVDYMAASMKYTTGGVKDSLPSTELTWNVCAVCEREIITDGSSVERTYRLTCDHLFHEFCIRGWCIVGKKQTCPYCNEKVDLKRMFMNP